MALKDIHRSSFCLGGDSIEPRNILGQRNMFTSATGTLFLTIPYEQSITVLASVVEWPDEDLVHLSDPHFQVQLHMAIMGGVGSDRVNGTLLTELPGTIKIRVHKITFQHYKHLLMLCDRDELLEQDEDIKAGL